MKYIKKLTGKRLYLAPRNPEDAFRYAQWLNDPEVTITLPMAAAVITEAGEKEFLQDRKNHTYSIVRLDDDQLIGNCGFIELSHLYQSAEVGIFIGDKDSWGKGFGKDALSLILNYGFRVLNLHNIMLRCLAFNSRGINCYRSLGFREFGRRRESHPMDNIRHDVCYFDLLQEEFTPFGLVD